MPKFITRVELHNARQEDYNKLHFAMTAAKFHKYITDDQGAQFELPSAEYFSFGDITAVQVRDLALAAANSTGCSSWVVVSEFLNAAWSLRKVQTKQHRNSPPNHILDVLNGPATNPFSDVNALAKALKGR